MARFGKPFSFRLSDELEDRVRALAAREGVTVSHLVRSIFAEQLERVDRSRRTSMTDCLDSDPAPDMALRRWLNL